MPVRSATHPVVFLGGSQQPDEDYHVIRCTQNMGGGQLDSCEIFHDLGPTAKANNQRRSAHLINTFMPPGKDIECEVQAVVNGQIKVYHWGKIKEIREETGEQLDREILISRVEPHFFGDPVVGYVVRNPATGDDQFVNLPMIFNPAIDSIVEGNRSPFLMQDKPAYLFLDPESCRTLPARQYAQGLSSGNRFKWHLTDAVHHLLQILNFSEVYFKNPTRDELRIVLGEDEDLLRDIVIPFGTYLPKALDLILDPYGFSWRIDYQPFLRTIRVLRRDLATPIDIPMQLPGEEADGRAGNVAELKVGFNWSPLVNEIWGYGSRAIYESTFELQRPWAPAQDTLHAIDLATDADDYETYPRVWRDWVLNEAGDYKGVRDEFETFADLPALIGGGILPEAFVPRRRKFLKMLSMHTDDPDAEDEVGITHGVELEWYNINNPNGATWQPVTWPFALLEKECGIRFIGHFPPEEMIVTTSGVKLRITACVESDLVLFRDAPMQGSSMSGEAVPLHVDLSSRFHLRVVGTSSKYFATVDAGSRSSDAIDDGTKLQDYINDLRDTWDRLDVNGVLSVEGCDNMYTVGDGVRQINGRLIFLNATSSGSAYPSVMSIEFDFEQQRTALQLSTYRHDEVRVGADLKRAFLRGDK